MRCEAVVPAGMSTIIGKEERGRRPGKAANGEDRGTERAWKGLGGLEPGALGVRIISSKERKEGAGERQIFERCILERQATPKSLF